MREIDLLLLEEIMQRHSFDAGRNARAFQIGRLMVVLLGLAAVLAHALVQVPSAATAATGNSPDAAQHASFSKPAPVH